MNNTEKRMREQDIAFMEAMKKAHPLVTTPDKIETASFKTLCDKIERLSDQIADLSKTLNVVAESIVGSAPQQSPRATIVSVATRVAHIHGVSLNAMRSRVNTRIISNARMEAYYRIHTELGRTFAEIARFFNKADHSCVSYGIRVFLERNGLENKMNGVIKPKQGEYEDTIPTTVAPVTESYLEISEGESLQQQEVCGLEETSYWGC